jgi:hypothetical protein
MPRFYLHLHDGKGRIEDPEGSDLPDLAAAREEALASARQLWAAAIIAQDDLTSHRFEVTDVAGALLLSLAFNEALPAALRPNSLRPISGPDER